MTELTAPEFLIRRACDPWPTGSATWTLQEARGAADYATTRSAHGSYEVVTREVTAYTVVPDDAHAVAALTPRNPLEYADAEYLRGLRDARATVAGADPQALSGHRFPEVDPRVPAQTRTALKAIDRLIADTSSRTGRKAS
jgi:hypothetical protein